MTYRHFVEQVRTVSGTSDDARIERAIAMTLEALGERLRAVDARAVARRLPPELACHLRGRAGLPVHLDERADEIVQHVCVEAGVEAEELKAICRVLAQSLDEQGRAQLRMQPLSSLFVQANVARMQ